MYHLNLKRSKQKSEVSMLRRSIEHGELCQQQWRQSAASSKHYRYVATDWNAFVCIESRHFEVLLCCAGSQCVKHCSAAVCHSLLTVSTDCITTISVPQQTFFAKQNRTWPRHYCSNRVRSRLISSAARHQRTYRKVQFFCTQRRLIRSAKALR